MVELNLQVAIFRDLLLGVGSARDCPEMRERIRKVRMDAMQAGPDVCLGDWRPLGLNL